MWPTWVSGLKQRWGVAKEGGGRGRGQDEERKGVWDVCLAVDPSRVWLPHRGRREGAQGCRSGAAGGSLGGLPSPDPPPSRSSFLGGAMGGTGRDREAGTLGLSAALGWIPDTFSSTKWHKINRKCSVGNLENTEVRKDKTENAGEAVDSVVLLPQASRENSMDTPSARLLHQPHAGSLLPCHQHRGFSVLVSAWNPAVQGLYHPRFNPWLSFPQG